MKARVLAAAAGAALLSASAAIAAGDEAPGSRTEVVYTVVFMRGDEVLAAPTVGGQFGHEVRVEVPDFMRVDVSAQTPDDESRSLTVARMSVFKDGAWQAPQEMSMTATLSMTPSFEYSAPGTPYRFVVMPRQVQPASGQGQP